MKKFLAMFLACVMVLSMLPVSTFAAEESDTHSHCPGEDAEHTVANCAHAIVKEEVAGYCGGYSYTWYECPECGVDFADGFVKSDATHKFDNVISEQVNATCLTDGKKALVKCSLCGAVDPERDGSVIKGGDAHDLKMVSAVCVDGICKVTYGCTACDYTETKDEKHVWNTMPEILEKPGYTTIGKAQYTCVNCGETKIVDIDANHGHDINKEYEAKAPTCTEDGNIAYWECECGAKFVHGTNDPVVNNGIIPKLNHNNWEDAAEKAGSYVAPTCTEKGSKVVICAVEGCGAEHTVEIPATGHKYGENPEYRKDPTCTDYGYEVYACVTCGYSEDLVMLDPLGHTWYECELHANATENVVLDEDFATATTLPITHAFGTLSHVLYYNSGTAAITDGCVKLTPGPNEHNNKAAFSWLDESKIYGAGRVVYKVDMSKLEIGATYKVSASFKANKNQNGHIVIQGQNYNVDNNGINDDNVFVVGTTWVQKEFQFTVAESYGTYIQFWFGSNSYFDNTTDYLLVDDIKIEKLYSADCQKCADAKLVDDLVKTDANCTTDGSYNWTCARCNLAMSDKIDMTGHAPATKVVDARCHQYGYTFTYCTNENCTLDAVSSVTVDGVEYSVLVDNNPVHLIGDIVVDKESGYDPDNHTRDNSESVVVNEPTCTEDGNEVFFCLYCNFYDADRILPALGHDMGDYVVTVQPDCENAGEKTSTCKNGCGHAVIRPVGALGHAWSKDENEWTVVDASCSAGGTVTIPCTRCDETQTVETDPALGFEPYYEDVVDALKIHKTLNASSDLTNEEEWKVLRAGDCLTIGLYTSVEACEDCGKKILVVIDGTGNGHVEPDWEAMIKENIGETFAEWWVNGLIDYEHEDDDGRLWTPKLNATCIEDGHTAAYVCESCGTYVASEVIEANGEHVKKEGTVVEHLDATCTENGRTEGWECANCDYKVVSEVIEKKGHNIVGIDSAALSCTQFRYAHIGCTECDYEIIKWYQDATGHNMEDGEVVTNNPTCEKDGSKVTSCANGCGHEETETIPATGHKNADGDELVNSCLNEVEDRVCVNENCDYDDNIVPNAHKEKVTTGNATCCTYAYVLHTCEVEGCDWHVLEEDTVAGYADHTWIVDETTDTDGYKVTVKPTFHSKGTAVRVCSVCKQSESKEIAALTGLGLSLDVDNDVVSGATIVESGKIAVTVKIDGNDVDVWGLRFSVNYDNKVLKFDNYKVVSADFVSMNTAYDNGSSVTVVANVHNSTDKQAVDVNINAEQDLVVLYFSIISNQQKDFNDAITVTSIESLNAAAESIDTANGSIVYEISKFLDYNDDDKVNMADLMEIYNIISSGSAKYDAHLDVDKNGTINARDFVAIYKYLSGQLSYEKMAKGEID